MNAAVGVNKFCNSCLVLNNNRQSPIDAEVPKSCLNKCRSLISRVEFATNSLAMPFCALFVLKWRKKNCLLCVMKHMLKMIM